MSHNKRYAISTNCSFRTRTLCIATDEDLRGRNVLHSLRVHSCASMLNNICSESMSAARMSLYSINCSLFELYMSEHIPEI